MEKLNDVLGLQAEFGKFKEEYKNDLLRFIGYKDDVDFVLDEKAETFYFSPKEKKIGIPMEWLVKYTTLLHNNDKTLESHKIEGKFSLAHEFSHFRDMLKEQEITNDSSMYRVLKKLSGKKIQIDDKKIIPIGKMIHTIYNCIDDIIVNYEVMNFKGFGIDKSMVEEIYQKNLFADYKTLPDKSKKLNLDEPVDYSKMADYTALSYYFLRKKMVPNQKIILSDNLKKILFNEKGQNIPWGTSLKRLKELFNKEVEEAKNSDNPVIKARYEQLKLALSNQKNKLDNINTLGIIGLLDIALKSLKNYDICRISSPSLTLERIIDLFTVNKGGDDSHILCISPDLRYKIYEAIFEPIIETLILIHALHNDIQDGNGGGNLGGGGEGGGKGGEEEGEGGEEGGEGEGEGGEEGGEGEGEGGEPQSGNGSYNRSLEDALKFIEEAAEYNQDKEKEAQRKKESEKIGKTIIEVLGDKNISAKDWDFKEKIQKNFSEYITQITKILYDELYALDIQRDTTNVISKKGSLNYNEFMKEFSKSFIDGDFSEKSIYDRKRNIEKIKEEFKKLCFYFMIDVSGSTDGFKGENGLLNGIPLSLALAIKNAERAIQNLSGDPSYKIPIKFIIYTDSVNYFTDDKDMDDIETEIVRVSSKIATISGGTEDKQGWSMVGKELTKDFQNHPEYISDIKGGKLKPVVVQIADTDVSEDGVKGLEEVIEKNFGTEIKDALMPKRIILGKESDSEKAEEEVNKKGNRSPEYIRLPDGSIKTDEHGRRLVKTKEIGVRNKKEIVDGIRTLFKNFFADMIKERL